FLEGGFDGVGRRDIQIDRHRRRAHRTKFRDRLRVLLNGARGRDHIVTGIGQRKGDRAADSAARSSNKNYPFVHWYYTILAYGLSRPPRLHSRTGTEQRAQTHSV